MRDLHAAALVSAMRGFAHGNVTAHVPALHYSPRTEVAYDAAAQTEPSALARERDQALGLAPDAPESCEPASEEAARQERPKLLLDKARHALTVAEVRCLGEERLQVLAYHTM